MQDEVNEKIIALCVQTTRMSTGVLKASMRKFLDGMSRQKQKRVQVKQAVKTGKAQEKGRAKERKRQEMKKPHGKQTIKQLIAQGAQLTNIQITDQNIKSFDRVARKWNVDYAFYKTGPDKYLLFFKAGQADAITACFERYSRRLLEQSKSSRIPIREQLKKAAEQLVKEPPKTQERTKEVVREKR